MIHTLRNPRGFFVLAAVAIGTLAGGSAFAADQSWSISGQSLKINSPCAKLVTIEPTDRLTNQVEVRAEAEHQEEIDRLEITSGSVALIDRNKPTCWSPYPHVDVGSATVGLYISRPTLHLTVRVPTGFALDVKEGGSGDYRIGPVGGALVLALSGSGNATADSVKDLNLLLSGSGTADVVSLAGKLDGLLSGSGSLTVQHSAVTHAELKVSGSGDVKIDDGTLGDAALRMSGSGDVRLSAVSDFTVASSGSSGLAVKSVNGPMTGRFSGSGSARIAAIAASSVELEVNGSTEVKLGTGTIGVLHVSSHGSSDIVVNATVGDADLELAGSGNVSVAAVSGRMAQSSHGSGHIKVGGV